jgi:beta-aspartyl-dipeptidase (metallo-type)
MFKLLKNVECYSPEYQGRKDILLVFDKIVEISSVITIDKLYHADIIECKDKIACPGFIDQHVHISGGGGEEGPKSIIGPIDVNELISSGVTTAVGLLGADSVSKSMEGLLMKARSLESEGLTTFIYSGHYGIPTSTITGRIMTDVALIDKVIGAGEIAISDFRSSNPTQHELMNLAYEVLTGGLLGKKAGVVHLHVGNGKEGLGPLLELVEESDYPVSMFVPTHLNRNKALFRQAVQYRSNGGNIDLTAGENTEAGVSVPECLKQLLENGTGLDRVTVSSDGNGSGAGASGKETGKVMSLFDDIKTAVQSYKLPLAEVLKTVTSNVAGVLKLNPQKGRLTAGSDADIMVLDKLSFNIDKLFVKGRLAVDKGTLLPGAGR